MHGFSVLYMPLNGSIGFQLLCTNLIFRFL
uniref:Uncharacterized protein n=1 Tax=Arundo donax TaxID=35708 RepID=A0A0A9ADJ8_ARUDO